MTAIIDRMKQTWYTRPYVYTITIDFHGGTEGEQSKYESAYNRRNKINIGYISNSSDDILLYNGVKKER